MQNVVSASRSGKRSGVCNRANAFRHQSTMRALLEALDLGFRICLEFRISDLEFGMRHD